jgi:cell division protein FtsI (penicillin-binding protein 3)
VTGGRRRGAGSSGHAKVPQDKPRSKSPKGRFGTLFLGLALLLMVVAGRLVWLQVVAAPAFAAKAYRQRVQDIALSPKRGAIFDREGQPLAVSYEAKVIFATPHSIRDPKPLASALAATLGGKPADYLGRLTKDTGFVYIARKVPVDEARALDVRLKKEKLKGIGMSDDSARAYPCGDLACQVLGFVGVDDKGLDGLELQYDKLLGGRPGRLITERDANGYPIPGGVQQRVEPVNGRDITLTIDKDIQYEAQVQLAETVKQYNAKSGQVLVMDPRDGSILALASTPTFNPNQYRKADATAIRNKPVTDAYEPGSTMKSMTAASVIDKGLFTPTSRFHLPPTIRVGGRTIHESHGRGAVDWTLTQIVTNSSNVGAVKLGMALGPRGIADYFGRFGLLERTGIDFPGEAKGWMPPPNAWSASTIGNVPFGQGVSVTVLQLGRALSALASGGTIPTPHLLASVPGRTDLVPVWPRRRAISAATAAKMTVVLSDVVTEGTGKAAAVRGYSVAGKTGTAQKPLSHGRGYAAGKYVASFSGYLPAEDPRVLVIVTIDEPQSAIYGGAVAAPAFSKIAEFSVSHLRIPPPVTRHDVGASSALLPRTTAPAPATATETAHGTVTNGKRR